MLMRCYLTSHPQVQSWGVTDNVGVSPQEGMSSGDHQTYWRVLSYEFHHLRSCHLSLVSSDAKSIKHKVQSTQHYITLCTIFNNINNILHLDQSQFFYTQMVVEMTISPTAHPGTAASKLPNIAASHILRGCSA